MHTSQIEANPDWLMSKMRTNNQVTNTSFSFYILHNPSLQKKEKASQAYLCLPLAIQEIFLECDYVLGTGNIMMKRAVTDPADKDLRVQSEETDAQTCNSDAMY